MLSQNDTVLSIVEASGPVLHRAGDTGVQKGLIAYDHIGKIASLMKHVVMVSSQRI